LYLRRVSRVTIERFAMLEPSSPAPAGVGVHIAGVVSVCLAQRGDYTILCAFVNG